MSEEANVIDTASASAVAPVASENATTTDVKAEPQKTEPAKSEELIFGKFKTLDDAAKAHKELEKGFHSRVAIPGENATKEERDAFFAKMGRPDTADGYGVEIPADNPNEAEVFRSLTSTAHDLGLSKGQMAGLLDWAKAQGGDYQAKAEQARIANEEAFAKQSQSQLMSRWGGDYEKNVDAANRAGVRLFGEEKFNELVHKYDAKGNKIGSNPDVVEMLYEIGRKVGEDSIPDRSRASSVTKDEAMSQRLAIMNDKGNPLYDAYRKQTHKDHKFAVEKVNELTRIAFN